MTSLGPGLFKDLNTHQSHYGAFQTLHTTLEFLITESVRMPNENWRLLQSQSPIFKRCVFPENEQAMLCSAAIPNHTFTASIHKDSVQAM